MNQYHLQRGMVTYFDMIHVSKRYGSTDDKRTDLSGDCHFCCFPFCCLGNRIFDFSRGDAQHCRDYEQQSNGFPRANARRGIGGIDPKFVERKKKRERLSISWYRIWPRHLYVLKFDCRFTRILNPHCKQHLHTQYSFASRIGRSTLVADATTIRRFIGSVNGQMEGYLC